MKKIFNNLKPHGGRGHTSKVIRQCGNKATSSTGRGLEGICELFGFTLAEILVTLAIIGVVAALTIPTIVKNYQKRQTVVALKKAYSELSNAINNTSINYGTPDTWDYTLSAKDFFNKYLGSNLQVTKVCPDNKTTKQCYGVEYRSTDKKTISNALIIRKTSHKVFLKDGTILTVSPLYTENSRSIGVDINGVKKPNTFGIDMFSFVFNKDNKTLMPVGYSYGRDYIIQNYESSGGCTALIMQDGWKISDDYPCW